ncbi:cAMP-binding domain of CRP or a regulatory subunit of cAMP-dependent protein kinases [Sphingomonas sp. OK281]|nr:cAMP-binding domain of CRP or a regulatory subunit of cAMP-dependent protein kinases [Sphingomonas sp. OK281]
MGVTARGLLLPGMRSVRVDISTVSNQLVRKFASRVTMQAEDRAKIAALPFKVRTIEPSTYMLREGQHPTRCAFIVEGLAYRQKLTPNGEREIVSIIMPGEFVDLQNLFLEESDHDIQALTRLTLAEIPITALRELVATCPAAGQTLWVDALVEASIHREWLLNIGRRNARTRLAHLLCEFSVRFRTSAGDDMAYELPMTQEQLGDALGLTPVHVNRVLKSLEAAGLIARKKRQVSVIDWPGLRDTAEFNERYLHLNQTRI